MRVLGSFYYDGEHIVLSHCSSCDVLSLTKLQTPLKLRCDCKRVEMEKAPLYYLLHNKPSIVCYLVDYPIIDRKIIGLHFPVYSDDIDILRDPHTTELSRPKGFFEAMVDQQLFTKIHNAENYYKHDLHNLLKNITK